MVILIGVLQEKIIFVQMVPGNGMIQEIKVTVNSTFIPGVNCCGRQEKQQKGDGFGNYLLKSLAASDIMFLLL